MPDELLPELPLNRYRIVVVTGSEYLEKAERDSLSRDIDKGGKVLVLKVSAADRDRVGAAGAFARRKPAPPPIPKATEVTDARTDRDGFLKQLDTAAGGADRFTRFGAPWTVQVHAYREPGKRSVVHLVNCDRDENAKGKSVSAREAPITAKPVAAK